MTSGFRFPTGMFIAFQIAFGLTANAESCIISGSTNSVPVSVNYGLGTVSSGNVALPTSSARLEARGFTWLCSEGIGIDPTLRPGFMLFLR